MPNNAEQEIRELEENLTQATRRIDIEALKRFYADDIMFTGVTGAVCDKSALMAEARRGVAERQGAAGMKVVAYDKADIKVVAHGDTAVTSFGMVIKIQGEDKGINRRYRTTNVWMKRQDRWQVIAAHTAHLE